MFNWEQSLEDAWGHLGVLQEELEDVLREKDVWATLLSLLPPRSGNVVGKRIGGEYHRDSPFVLVFLFYLGGRHQLSPLAISLLKSTPLQPACLYYEGGGPTKETLWLNPNACTSQHVDNLLQSESLN